MTKETSAANSDSEVWIPLAEMLQMLRQELEVAQIGGAASDLRFQVEKVDLELKIAVSRTKRGSGGIKFWVVNAGGAFEKMAETIHTFTLSLTPISASSGGRVQVSAKPNQRVTED